VASREALERLRFRSSYVPTAPDLPQVLRVRDIAADAPPDLPRPLKVRDIANAADTPKSTVQQALRDGRFPNAFKLGGQTSEWRIPIEDALAFLRGEAPPAPQRSVSRQRRDQDVALK
jgi:predicted DNA-binding transcriptional regulator AlpA